jgi:hypothetical protein
VNRPVWSIKEVLPQPNYTLLLVYYSGEQRIYDARPLLDKNIYAPLKSIAFFLQAKADFGTVVWSDEIDIAPEHLFENSVVCTNSQPNQ